MEDKIIEKLNQMGQQHITKRLDNNENLRGQICKIDFDEIMKLYKGTKKNTPILEKYFEGIGYVEKDKLSMEEYGELEKIGNDVIKNGKYAVVTMAGGQGTRLGHNGPKGTFDFGLSSHKTIFEVLCEKLKDAYKKYNIYIPWYIMTSKENNSDTIKFFENNKYFNYPKENITFFIQDELPMLNEEGKIIIGEDKRVKQAADGHGGIFASMDKNNIIEDMKKRKRKKRTRNYF